MSKIQLNDQLNELTHISAEIKAIVIKTEVEGRKMNREEQETLEQLTTTREALVSDIIFHGYV